MRCQPLNALEKDTYVAPKWSAEMLDLVARARRVFGKGGAFPPYEGLIKKFLDAKDFKEAFSVWADGIVSKNKSFANETKPKTIVFRNYSIAVQESDRAWSRKNDRVVDKYYAAGAEALGGKHAILVSNKGRVKKISLLGVYRNITGEHEIQMYKGEKIFSVIIEFDAKDNLYMVSRDGRIGAFPAESIGSKSLDGPFAKRLEIDDGDEVVSVFCSGMNKQVFIISKSGWVAETDKTNSDLMLLV
jgi:DNA gyrase/topoisomerase IV subunit A